MINFDLLKSFAIERKNKITGEIQHEGDGIRIATIYFLVTMEADEEEYTKIS